jgi:hypothetical protein
MIPPAGEEIRREEHMQTESTIDATLIPPSALIRAELARNVREARRLRSLLRLSIQAEEDRQFLRSLTVGTYTTCQQADGRAVRQ